MSVESLLGRLHGVRQTGQGRWLARCSGHEDRRASLSVRELDDGRILVHCFAGCTADEVVGGAGLRLEDLFPPRSDADHVPGERRPIPAADVLRAIAEETIVVSVIGADIHKRREISDADHARLLVAAERIAAAARIALGQR